MGLLILRLGGSIFRFQISLPYLFVPFLFGIGLWFLPNLILPDCLCGAGLVGFISCLVCLVVGCFKVFLRLLIVCYSIGFIGFI